MAVPCDPSDFILLSWGPLRGKHDNDNDGRGSSVLDEEQTAAGISLGQKCQPVLHLAHLDLVSDSPHLPNHLFSLKPLLEHCSVLGDMLEGSQDLILAPN